MDIERTGFACRVEEVHSGDDLMVFVDLGVDGLWKRTRVRLHGVDAPNAFRASPSTEAGKVRDEVKRLTAGKCYLHLVREGGGGWIAELDAETPSGETININSLLQDKGYTYPAGKQKT